jgi:C-terminal processing protease CtpA/Prc
MQWVQETVHLQGVPIAVNHMDGSRGKSASSLVQDTITTRFRNSKYSRKFTSSKSGLLKGDVIISINKNPAYKYSLQKINLFLKTRNGSLSRLKERKVAEIQISTYRYLKNVP